MFLCLHGIRRGSVFRDGIGGERGHVLTAVPSPNTQSPVNTACSSSNTKTIWSSVCPGVYTALKGHKYEKELKHAKH